MSVEVKRRLVSVEEYHKMAEVGILTKADRVELIRGEIYQMSPIGSKHAACVMRLVAWFPSRLQGKAMLNVQNLVQLDDLSEPEPDLVLLKPRDDFYELQHPQPEDILLLIEVCDSSFSYDKEIKLPVYAKAGIPETWLVNLDLHQIEVYTHPEKGAYLQQNNYQAGGEIPLRHLSLSCPVHSILG